MLLWRLSDHPRSGWACSDKPVGGFSAGRPLPAGSGMLHAAERHSPKSPFRRCRSKAPKHNNIQLKDGAMTLVRPVAGGAGDVVGRVRLNGAF